MNLRELDNNNHSVFSLKYHLIMCTKYRRNVIDDDTSDRLKNIFEYIGANHYIELIEWNHDCNHVHILFKAQPRCCLTKFINAYKSASSRLIKKEYPHVRKQLFKEMFWSQSFCLLTVGETSENIIKQYIQTQGEKHE